MGVTINGTLPSGYQEVIEARYNNTIHEIRKVFDSYAEQLIVQDSEYFEYECGGYLTKDTGRYKRGVYYNAKYDMVNPRSPGTTYFHELAHMIDHAATGFQGLASSRDGFREALLLDGQNFINGFNSISKSDQEAFLEVLRKDDRTHSLQDLVEATTDGSFKGIHWGHGREYWESDEDNLTSEAFAHFFEASTTSTDKLQALSFYFPESFKVFLAIIEDMCPKSYEKVLRKELTYG